jgi:hypothetical protein
MCDMNETNNQVICGNVHKMGEMYHWIDNYHQLLESFQNMSPISPIEPIIQPPKVKRKTSVKNQTVSQNSASAISKNVTKSAKNINSNNGYGQSQQKVLLLTGNSGSGKTLFGNLIFQRLKCKPIALEIGERSLKKLFEQTTKYYNVIEYMGGNRSANSNIGLWLDDIDVLFADSVVYSEIMEILRTNTFKIPIVASCKETDKKICEFRKYCTEIKMGKCSKQEITDWLIDQFQTELNEREPLDQWVESIIHYSNGDFRTMKQILFELKREIRINPNYLKNRIGITEFFDMYQMKNQENTIFDNFQKILSIYQMSSSLNHHTDSLKLSFQQKKSKIQEIMDISESDTYLLSNMMNHNYHILIEEKQNTFYDKLEMGSKISKNYVLNNKYYSNYNQLNNSLSHQYNIFNSIILPTKILSKSKNRTNNPPIVKYPLIFNKLSQNINNMRHLQHSFSFPDESEEISHYRKISSIINDSSLWTKYYISQIIYQLIQNGIVSIDNDGNSISVAIGENSENDGNIKNPGKNLVKHKFINEYMRKKWLQIQRMNITIDDLENWLKYYKILFWNNADDKKILIVRKKDVLIEFLI